jgi:hypothetical protein
MSEHFTPAMKRLYQLALEEVFQNFIDEFGDYIRPEVREAYARICVELLDRMDLDPDLEPSLGSVEQHTHRDTQEFWAFGGTDDLEADPSDCEDGGDDEPSLGWTVSGVNTSTGIFDLDCEEERAQ